MRTGVLVLKLLDAHLRVDPAWSRAPRAQEAAGGSEWPPRPPAGDRAGVAKEVTTASSPDLRPLHVLLHQQTQDVGIERFPLAGQEQRLLPALHRQQKTLLLHVTKAASGQSLAQWNDPILLP
jgi:hypothetical protein